MTTFFVPTAPPTASGFDRRPVVSRTFGTLKRFLTALMHSLAVAHA